MENVEHAPEAVAATEAPAAAATEAASAPAEATNPQQDYTAVPVTVQSLLKAGAHYGHQTRKWNPKMSRHIFGSRNGVHIINLDDTYSAWEKARKFITTIAARGGEVLFVGTKKQARDVVLRHAERSGSYHVTSRWLGGTLSNFQTVKRSIERMNKMEELLKKAQDEDSDVRLNKKERLGISRNLEKLEVNLGGIRNMRRVPDLLFIIDVNKESIAVNEARKLHIPVVALVDSNADPEGIEFPIPSNDDASRTLDLFCAAVADAVIDGQSQFKIRMAQNAAAEKEKRKKAKEKAKAKAEKKEAKAEKKDAKADKKEAKAAKSKDAKEEPKKEASEAKESEKVEKAEKSEAVEKTEEKQATA